MVVWKRAMKLDAMIPFSRVRLISLLKDTNYANFERSHVKLVILDQYILSYKVITKYILTCKVIVKCI